jgi:hypothetical protein
MDLGLPTDLTWYKLLTDLGSLIGGGFALIAGAVAYIGARQAATKETGAMARKDRNAGARNSGGCLPPNFWNCK